MGQGIKIAFIAAIMLRMSLPLKESSIFIGQMVSALLLFFNGIGLIMKRNWVRRLIFIAFPLYLLFSVLFQYFAVNSLSSALLRNSFVIIFYIIILYLYTQPKIKEQFKY
jgi:hypothetical protein